MHDEETISRKIKQLGSESFQEREAATKWLWNCPEAEASLQKALTTADLEVARRVNLILDEFQRLKLKDLQAAIKQGSLDRAIWLLAKWPKGKQEDAVWEIAKDLATKFMELHKKEGADYTGGGFSKEPIVPVVISAERIWHCVKGPRAFVFMRAGKVSFNDADSLNIRIICASDSVGIGGSILSRNFVFAGGPVELNGTTFINHIVVSYGKVELYGDMNNSLIIARDNILLQGRVSNSRIISAKSVFYEKSMASNCVITENESHPLGYVRFGDVPRKGPAVPPKSDPAKK
ncbi:MAG: hypothetical protein L0Y70_02355 [Gemmataceae bacterium]|nr:hypothetical protein [Gemmataceae bacterium]